MSLKKLLRTPVEFAVPDRLTKAIQRAIDELIDEGVIKPETHEHPEDYDRYEVSAPDQSRLTGA